MADEVTLAEVPPAEVIAEGGSPQEAGESGGVADSGETRLREELEREKKRTRDFQAEKDRYQSELKKRERSEMDEVERLKAEAADAEAKAVQAEAMANYYYVENLKNELTSEYNLKSEFKRFLHGADEDDLRKNAKELSELVASLGAGAAAQKAKEDEENRREEPPNVTGGSGISPEYSKEFEKLAERGRKTGNWKPLITFKREHGK